MQRLSIQEPWLHYIENGSKKFEGRLSGGTWASLGVGEQIITFSDRREVCLRIVGHQKFSSFGDAWLALGESLIPVEIGVSCETDVNLLYSQFWSTDKILSCGVDVVEVEVINV